MGLTWVFVMGPPRSGTSLMAEVLSVHPQCHILWETLFPLNLDQAISPRRGGSSGYLRASFHHTFDPRTGDISFARSFDWRMSRVLGEPNRVRRVEIPAATAVRAMCEGLASAYDGLLWFGDKNPDYCFEWRRLLEIFPDALFVITDRETEATMESVMRQDWSDPRYKTNPQMLRDQIEKYKDAVSGCPNAVTVDIASMNQDPRGQVMRVLSYCGMGDEFLDEMVSVVVDGEKVN